MTLKYLTSFSTKNEDTGSGLEQDIKSHIEVKCNRIPSLISKLTNPRNKCRQICLGLATCYQVLPHDTSVTPKMIHNPHNLQQSY